jgi:hypothetical protein
MSDTKTILIDRRFIKIVARMRKAQVKFYDSPHGQGRQSVLVEAKRLEHEVDGWLEQLEKDLAALDEWTAEALFEANAESQRRTLGRG